MAAHRLDLLGDGAGRPALGSLEGHMLKHMGDAIDLGRLVARADIGPGANGYRLDGFHVVGGDREAVFESRYRDCHAALPFAISPRIWASTAAKSLGKRTK